MRSFGLVERKLEEADFFLDKVEAANWADISHYFSAFVAASRSVTFAMQGCLKGAPGFEDWYGGWQARLRGDLLARFFHECRTDGQHLGICPIRGGAGGPSMPFLFFFGQDAEERFKWLPETDVVTSCRTYMRTVCEVVNDAFRVFGFVIDPNQIFTLEGLTVKGWTIEDVEAYLGYPRGYTDIPWEGGDKDSERLAMLRRQISMSYIGSVLEKHIPPEYVFSRPPGWEPQADEKNSA